MRISAIQTTTYPINSIVWQQNSQNFGAATKAITPANTPFLGVIDTKSEQKTSTPNRTNNLSPEAMHEQFRQIDRDMFSSTKEMEMFGKKVQVTESPTGEESMPVQLQTTFRCPHDCSFCIEDATGKKYPTMAGDDRYEDFVNRILDDLKNNGRKADISITGGEPLLNYNRAKIVLDVIKSRLDDVLRYGINTSGTPLRDERYIDLLNKQFETGKFHVNISRHHYDDEINAQIFRGARPLSTEDLKELNDRLNGRL
ncbi:MAG: radical SAM protein, partial [Alphaproteobacteria bacterium]|nr:radical SAM protein [Alphaproteobacteria bacterium]